MRDKVTRQCPQTTTFEEKGQPKRIRIEVPLLTRRKEGRIEGRKEGWKEGSSRTKIFSADLHLRDLSLTARPNRLTFAGMCTRALLMPEDRVVAV